MRIGKRVGTRTEKRRRARERYKAFREFVLRLPIYHCLGERTDDAVLKIEEEKTRYRRLDEGTITKERLGTSLKRAVMVLTLSDLAKGGLEAFVMQRQCGGVENQFDTPKNVLNADKMYQQDDESVFGHLFTPSVALYGYLLHVRCCAQRTRTSP